MGCGNAAVNSNQQSNQVSQEHISESENEGSEVVQKDEGTQVENHDETKDEDKDPSNITVDENGVLHIETSGFVKDMDEVFENLEDYEGKTLSYEGILIQTDEATKQHAVARVYDMDHGDHSHSIYVGLDVNYDGEWPKLNSWVKVEGTIERANAGGEDYPVLKVKEMTVTPEVGELTVVD